MRNWLATAICEGQDISAQNFPSNSTRYFLKSGANVYFHLSDDTNVALASRLIQNLFFKFDETYASPPDEYLTTLPENGLLLILIALIYKSKSRLAL